MTVVPAPVSTLNPFSNVCSDANQFQLAGGLPVGRTYSGAGIMNNVFNPAVGSGTYQITYTFVDSMMQHKFCSKHNC
ncbi:MAG: hypothetical protein IPP27_15635 [Bacteroidetes bacterium]|nr:hypothetical protein [Bacteroidota bacterium]